MCEYIWNGSFSKSERKKSNKKRGKFTINPIFIMIMEIDTPKISCVTVSRGFEGGNTNDIGFLKQSWSIFLWDEFLKFVLRNQKNIFFFFRYFYSFQGNIGHFTKTYKSINWVKSNRTPFILFTSSSNKFCVSFEKGVFLSFF